MSDSSVEENPTRSHADARALIDRAAYGIYRSNRSGRFVDVNQALVKMLRYDSAEQLYALDLSAELYADPADRARLVRRAVEGRLGGWTHTRWRTRDGATLTVRVVVNCIVGESGEVEFFEGIVEDVTESLRRDEIVRRSERMASLGTMLAGVAHELNNPLAAISGFAQLILRGKDLSEEDRAAIATIDHEANRAARIVRDLQTFGRERTSTEVTEVDLNAVVSYVFAAQRYKMDTHGIRRVVSLADNLPLLHADRAHVEQVLINLLGNANQALECIVDAPPDADDAVSRSEPTVWVSTRQTRTHVVLEVRDNGAGIDAADLPQVFDPFFTTRPEGEGSGLGLAVVHGIVSSYGGHLEVESERGKGALFTVSFPLGPEEPATAAGYTGAAATAESTAPTRLLDILIVEDEAAIRRLLMRYFESRGHSVVVAEDGVAALRAAEQTAYDVVICDLRLPGIDGFEVLRRLRALPTGSNCRCILMSGANSKSPTGPLKDTLRLSAIVDKPFEIDQLRSLVES